MKQSVERGGDDPVVLGVTRDGSDREGNRQP